MIEEVAENIKATVGYSNLAYGWCISRYLVSGIIPSMIYYGLQILSPAIFLPATVNMLYFLSRQEVPGPQVLQLVSL
jgi:NhaC family Na+:H+ antiporter